MEEENNLSLIYVNPIGENSNGLFEYEFFFSDAPDNAWAEDWAEQCPSVCENLMPDTTMYSFVKRIVTDIPLACAQNNSCFSLQDCVDGILSICYEDISSYEEYPTPYRLVFRYGEDYNSIKEKLEDRNISFEENNIQ